jgi:hypothetical protein
VRSRLMVVSMAVSALTAAILTEVHAIEPERD